MYVTISKAFEGFLWAVLTEQVMRDGGNHPPNVDHIAAVFTVAITGSVVQLGVNDILGDFLPVDVDRVNDPLEVDRRTVHPDEDVILTHREAWICEHRADSKLLTRDLDESALANIREEEVTVLQRQPFKRKLILAQDNIAWCKVHRRLPTSLNRSHYQIGFLW
ncbi:hypothetical protein D3C84_907350 [compost metagenome]